jgi:D-3-phosphoglycerate dehydrogenase
LRSNLKVLVAESGGFPQEARAALNKLGEVSMGDLDFSELWRAAPEFDVLWVRLRHRIDKDFLAHTPRLKAIVTPTTGLTHIDSEEAARRGITVFSLRGEVDFLKDVRATAEHTMALILSLMRQIPSAYSSVRSGQWNRDQFKGRELYNKKVGVVGYGRLGQIVARYLKVFGARVLAADPILDLTSKIDGVEVEPLPSLLARADVVTLHVNLNEETKGFFGWEQFRSMKRGAWFVNTARGELIDEVALLRALEVGRLAGAAIDVMQGEQSGNLSDSALIQYARRHDNLLITPHIGGCTLESMEKTETFLAHKVLAALRTKAKSIPAVV